MSTHYETLELSPSASLEDVKSAWKRLAKKHHPDRNPGSESAKRAFMAAKEAYDVLRDEQRRATYDLNLSVRSHPRPPAAGHQKNPFADFIKNTLYEELFRDVTGPINPSRNRPSAPAGPVPNAAEAPRKRPVVEHEENGKDVETELSVTLEEVSTGCLRPVMTRTGPKKECPGCTGSGCRPGTRSAPCASCAGRGLRSDFNINRPAMDMVCPACRGKGHHPLRPCIKCKGYGTVRAEQEVKVRIPVGIEDGQRLRLAGKGEPGVGRPPGDLFVTVKVMPHDSFTRDKQDLHLEHWVPLAAALRGGPVQIPTLGGPPMAAVVPAGMTSGKTTVTVRGAGLARAAVGSSGDMHVTLHVDLPKTTTARAARLIEELIEELGE